MYGYGYFSTFRSLSGGGVPVDPDAQAFITAASITDPTQQEAVNQLVVDLKGYSLWTKMKAVYPFVGGTGTSHSYNLRNTAQFQITWYGGLVHNSNGVKGNAVNAYGDTGCNLQTNLAATRMSMGSYIKSGLSGGGSQNDGARDTSIASWLYIDYIGGYTRNPTQADFISGTIGTKLHQTVRSASNLMEFYKDGVVMSSTTVSTSLANPNVTAYILAMNTDGSATNYNSMGTAFFYLAENMTPTNAVDLNTIVNAFQTAIGR